MRIQNILKAILSGYYSRYKKIMLCTRNIKACTKNRIVLYFETVMKMSLQINRTDSGTLVYPLHSHGTYEIMYYLNGEGYLKTEKGDIEFSAGTVIIVPPFMLHGSVSENGFENISVSGELGGLLNFDNAVILRDNGKSEAKLLAELLYAHRWRSDEFLSSLCNSYILLLLSDLKIYGSLDTAINGIISEISKNAFNSALNLKSILSSSGYATDYIRNRFRLRTGKTPTEFLTELRIKHARYLIDIYGNKEPLTLIAERCGFNDYVYFSRCFKRLVGCSPCRYRESRAKPSP